MKRESKFEALFQEGLEEIYGAEKQIIAALPAMIVASSWADLSEAFESHLEATREHVSRLESIFEQIAAEPGSRECRAMQALLAEGEKAIGTLAKSPARDAAIVAAARKVEHYEIACYQTACALAEVLAQGDAFDLLQETLDEEEEADETLAHLLEDILDGGEVADGAA